MLLILLCPDLALFTLYRFVPVDARSYLSFPHNPVLGVIVISSVILLAVWLLRNRVRLLFYALSPLALVSFVTALFTVLYKMFVDKKVTLLLAKSRLLAICDYSPVFLGILAILPLFVACYVLLVRMVPSRIGRREYLTLVASFVLVSYLALLPSVSRFTPTLDRFLTSVYPISLVYRIAANEDDVYKTNDYFAKSRHFSFRSYSRSDTAQRKVFVFVIGEASRADHWSLYGYQRETSPRLARMDNLLAFSNAAAAATSTSLSHPVLLTRATANDLGKWMEEKCIVTAFKEAGFKTYWLSSKPAINVIEKLQKKCGGEADEYIPLTQLSGPEDFLDGVMLTKLERAIASSHDDLFIVMHTNGSHDPYDRQVPENMAVFGGKKSPFPHVDKQHMVDTYDDTILYTDYFLSKVIERLSSPDIMTYMLYMSDHGENLGDDERELYYHASAPTIPTIHVPLLIWANDPYRRSYKDRWATLEKNRRRKIGGENIFHTLLDMADIGYPEERPGLSFASGAFVNSEQLIHISDSRTTSFEHLKRFDFAYHDGIDCNTYRVAVGEDNRGRLTGLWDEVLTERGHMFKWTKDRVEIEFCPMTSEHGLLTLYLGGNRPKGTPTPHFRVMVNDTDMGGSRAPRYLSRLTIPFDNPDPQKPVVVTLETPTWTPALLYKTDDFREIGLGFSGAEIEPLYTPGGAERANSLASVLFD